MDRLKRKSQSQSPVQPTKSKRLATVHFAETDDIVPIIDPASCISDRERKELWYSDQSLDAFNTEVRLLCIRRQDLLVKNVKVRDYWQSGKKKTYIRYI